MKDTCSACHKKVNETNRVRESSGGWRVWFDHCNGVWSAYTLEPKLSAEQKVEATRSQTKATNPKDMIGSGKMPLHLWPTTATAMGCLGLLNGMLKYGRTNWREAGVRTSIYVDALLRHTLAYWEGEEVDPDDGVPHLAAILACAAIIVDAKAAGKLNDDRAYNGGGYRKLIDELTPHVKRLKELHAERDPEHWTIKDNVSHPPCISALNLTGTDIDAQYCALLAGHEGECLFTAPERFRNRDQES